MKKAELKELIRNSILEGEYLEDDSKAMDAMDAAMVKDYEEEESNKHTLDKEEPMEEAKITADNRVEYLTNTLDMVWKRGKGNNQIDLQSLAQSLVKDMFDQESMQESLNDIPHDIEWEVEDVVGKVDDYDYELALRGYSPSTKKYYTAGTTGTAVGGGDYEWLDVYEVEEDNTIAEADAIVEAWISKKQALQEEVDGGYIELMEMNPKFDEGLEMLSEVWNEWKSGEMTEEWMIDEARQDLLEYLASILK